MFDHVTIRVADFEASKRFYATVLAPLGLSLGFYDAEKRIAEWGDFVIVDDGKPVAHNVHVAFAAKDNATVEAFLGRLIRPFRAPPAEAANHAPLGCRRVAHAREGLLERDAHVELDLALGE